jgi:pantetheine-phosphate adenylyltransferase
LISPELVHDRVAFLIPIPVLTLLESSRARMMLVKALYPGTFDPPTNGHVDLIQRGAKIFGHLTVAVLNNPGKNPLFSVAERVEMLQEVVRPLEKVSVATFDGLMVEFARQQGAAAVLRGIRAISDYEYEFQMALMNRRLAPEIETVFLQPAGRYSFISSRMLKEVFSFGGDVTGLVPPNVLRRLRGRMNKQ